MSRLLDDLRPMPLHARLVAGVDLLRGALDAHLRMRPNVSPSTRAAVRRAVVVAVAVWAALAVEIVLSNVVFPAVDDNDGVSVLISYLAIFAALWVIGVLTARETTSRWTFAVAGAIAGGFIGVLTIVTYVVIDNVFLDIISRQQAKIDGLAASGMTSMRAYVNTSLLFGFGFLSGFLALAGAGLAVAGGLIAQARQPVRRSDDAGESP
jgi:hypothetical protein